MKTLIHIKRFFILSMISASLFLVSCQSGVNPQIPGLKGPFLYLDQEYIRIDTVFENLQLIGGGRIPFSLLGLEGYDESFLEIGPDVQSDGTLVAINLSLNDLLYGHDGIDQLDPQALPDGRPLPGITGGRLPAIAFDVDSINNMGFYIGTRVFGIWYPIEQFQIGVNNIVTMRFYSDGRRTGNVSLVGPNDEGVGSGVLLMVDLGEAQKRYLKRYYKKLLKKRRRR